MRTFWSIHSLFYKGRCILEFFSSIDLFLFALTHYTKREIVLWIVYMIYVVIKYEVTVWRNMARFVSGVSGHYELWEVKNKTIR